MMRKDPDGERPSETIKTMNHLRGLLTAYRQPDPLIAWFQVSITVTVFIVFWIAMYLGLQVSYWLTLFLALPTAALAVRIFILQHDCGHGSLFRTARTNRIVGIGLSMITLTPFDCWRRQHALHHATNGCLDHRGVGDITTWTVREYLTADRFNRFKYRVFRHPLLLFGLGPVLYFALKQRLPSMLPKEWLRERWSVRVTNLLLLAVFVPLTYRCGLSPVLLVHLPVVMIAAAVGVWLFYVQHQFEDTYWERDGHWNFERAAMEGSSFLDLAWPLRWVTASIGYHHIHHLDSRIPNYRLRECFKSHRELQQARRLTLRSSVGCARLRLWDERQRRLVSLSEALRGESVAAGAAN